MTARGEIRKVHGGPLSGVLIVLALILSLSGPVAAEPAAAESAEEGQEALRSETVSTSTDLRIDGTAQLEANVGMLASVKGVVLTGTELTVRKVDPRGSAIMLRIDNVYSHGDGFRYDLTWMAWESGTHDLTDYLVRKDGSDMSSLPEIRVTAGSVLKDKGTQLNPLPTKNRVSAGGYRTSLMVAGVLWLIGFGFLISRGWSTRAKLAEMREDTPLTRLQQIESRLQRAVSQPESLSPAAKAELETLIVAFWREEKGLRDPDPGVAIVKLRQDPDAGPLLAVLERWLYDRPERSRFDGEALLQPFRRYAERQPDRLFGSDVQAATSESDGAASGASALAASSVAASARGVSASGDSSSGDSASAVLSGDGHRE